MKSRYLNSQSADYLAEAKACEKVLKELLRITEKWQRTLEKERAARRAQFETVMQYESELQIQDAYGWGFISEKEFERYVDLFRDGEQALNDLPPSLTQIALNIIYRIIGDMDASRRELEFSALTPEGQQLERERIEKSNREWKQRIADIRKRRYGIDGDHIADADNP